jgi:hypothetical protein
MKRSLLILAAAMMIVPAASAAVVYDAGPGTGAPSGTLGPYTMLPFVDPSGVFSTVTSIPSPIGGTLDFSLGMSHRVIGSGWATWSHGYFGDVYYSNGATAVTMTMPAGTGAFEFYVEPNPFTLQTFTATTDDGTTSGAYTAHGSAGATYAGFYGTGGSLIASVSLTGSTDFAVGEFGIATPEPASLALLALGGLAVIRRR